MVNHKRTSKIQYVGMQEPLPNIVERVTTLSSIDDLNKKWVKVYLKYSLRNQILVKRGFWDKTFTLHDAFVKKRTNATIWNVKQTTYFSCK